MLLEALPPELHELLNAGVAATSLVLLFISARYLLTEYETIRGLMRLKLAVAFTVMMAGLAPEMIWLWLARFLANINADVIWMGKPPWVFVPVISTAVLIAGMACAVRALTPEVWGRWGYVSSIGAAVAAASATLLARLFI